MNILITGGAGFIGSAFVRNIKKWQPQAKVKILDSLTYAGDRSRIENAITSQEIEFIQASITDENAVAKTLKNTDVVYHFAAETHVDRSLLNASAFFETNCHGTDTLIKCAIQAKVQKFVHVSTDEVYGACAQGKFNEAAPLQPTNPYSISKAASEWLVLNAYRQSGLPVIITRGSNTYGPYQYPEKIVPLFVSNLLNNQKIPLYGDGMQERDWIHADDHAQAIYFVSQKGKIGEIYNIPGNHALTNKALTQFLLRALKKDESYIHYVSDRLGHDRRYALDGAKINALGWQPQLTFESAMEETVRWYQDNQTWLTQIRDKQNAFKDYYRQQYSARLEKIS